MGGKKEASETKETKEAPLKTKIIPLTREMLHDQEKAFSVVEAAAKVIKKKGLVIYPTETAYGIGADATDEAAVKKIFVAKGRDEGNPIPVIVSSLRMMKEYAFVNKKAKHLAEKFMPGPLTLVVQQKPNAFPKALSKSGIAFRVPGREFARAIPAECGFPITSTSANISGQPPLYKISEVKRDFVGKVDLIVDAGDLPPVLPSTVIDVRHNPPKVVREGPLSSKEILFELKQMK